MSDSMPKTFTAILDSDLVEESVKSSNLPDNSDYVLIDITPDTIDIIVRFLI